jgi:hypothetical protein
MMIRLSRGRLISAIVLIFSFFCGTICARAGGVLQDPGDPTFSRGVDFVTRTFDQHPAVAIADLPGCDELHRFVRTLVQSPEFTSKVHSIVVDFGNPIYQQLIDRYLLDGELVSHSLLRRVWDDTTESPNLTWDSPVYAEFFDTIHALNLSLPKQQRVRVILADAPVSWPNVHSRQEWLALRGQTREKELAAKITDVLQQNERVLVISSPVHLYRSGSSESNARAIIEASLPGKVFVILPQTRFGIEDQYERTERRERNIPADSIAAVRDTWLGLLPLTADTASPRVQDVADAVLYLGRTNDLTRMQPSGEVFRDEEYWRELNLRWKQIYGTSFDLARAGFDLRGPFLWPPPQQIRIPSASGSRVENPVDFVYEKLKEYPIVGIGDMHTCLEYFQFVKRVIHDPRLSGNVQDIVVEFGNPLYQKVIDRYVFEGKNVPFAERKQVWQYATIGWYVFNSPIYEAFFDELRSVNLALPKNKRIRVILGDAPFDAYQFRKDPDHYLRPFVVYKETLQDPREISIAASITRVLATGHRGLVLSGNGHLNLTQRNGNARHIVERVYPNRFFLIDESGPGDSSWPVPSIATRPNDPEPNHATLWLGSEDRLTTVRPSPMIYRNPSYWAYINLMTKAQGQPPLDLDSPAFEYRSRYFVPREQVQILVNELACSKDKEATRRLSRARDRGRLGKVYPGCPPSPWGTVFTAYP